MIEYQILKKGDYYHVLIKKTKKKIFASPSYFACNAYLTQLCNMTGYRQVNTVNDPTKVAYDGSSDRYFVDIQLSGETGNPVICDNNCLMTSAVFETYYDEDGGNALSFLKFLNDHDEVHWELFFYEHNQPQEET